MVDTLKIIIKKLNIYVFHMFTYYSYVYLYTPLNKIVDTFKFIKIITYL